MSRRKAISRSYAALRVHGEHSFLAGVDGAGVLLERGAELGIGALGLVELDHGGGVVAALEAARDAGAGAPRVLVGAEISDGGGRAGRVVVLVRDAEGYRNLNRLLTARRLGGAPGEFDPFAPPADAAERFDLVGALARWHGGLTVLADHPRLVVALGGRLPGEHLWAAVHPAGAGLRPRRRTERGPRPGRGAGGGAGRQRDGEQSGGQRGEQGGEHARQDAAQPTRGGAPPARPEPALDLIAAARAVGIGWLPVPDVWYARAAGRDDHRVRTAILRGGLVCDLPEHWLAAEPAHLLSPTELAAAVADLPDLPGALRHLDPLERTLAVADGCGFLPELGAVHFPSLELEPGTSAYSALCELSFDGARRRYRPLEPRVLRRLETELGAIEALGYAPYFLLVRRLAEVARERGIPCVGRGSAADSLVAYCLGLTEADPLRYQLPFERFLNPRRRDRPDIDLDFCWRRRDEVLAEVYRTFGPERTAMISTLNRFGLRAAFAEAALASGLPPVLVRRWSRHLPHAPLGDGGARPEAGPIERALRSTPECRGFPFEDARWRAALAAGERLIDVPRHFGLHPGGVVVAPGPIEDFCALHASAKGPAATDLDKDGVEAVGLVKMDLLGNRALTVIDDCLQSLGDEGLAPDFAAVAEDEPVTGKLLREGRTLGCFQLESPGMRHLLRQMAAGDQDAVIQSVALIRPGPASAGLKEAFARRIRGLEPVDGPHPRFTAALAETYGLMLYQEDVMRVAAEVAGLDLADADELRRSLGKRRGGPDEHLLRERFLAGAAERGVDAAAAETIWERIGNFVSFSFCKAHAVTYGQLAWRTAYLKAHHPAHYLAAFLASHTGYYERRVYVEEARRLGVAILGPDINRSGRDFTLERRESPQRPGGGAAHGYGLRVGLGQVAGLSGRTVERLLEERRAGGAFVSLPDLLERVQPDGDEAERLIRAGALDGFDRTRPELLWRLHLLRQPARRPPRARAGDPLAESLRERPLDFGELAAAAGGTTGGWGARGLGLGQLELPPGAAAPLFPAPPTGALALPRLADPGAREKALAELELLGLTVALHPVRLFARDELEPERLARAVGVAPCPCAELPRRAGKRACVVGWLAASRRARTADGRWMRFLTLEDESGLAEVVLFAEAYRRFGHLLTTRGPFAAVGLAEDHLGAVTLHAERLI